MYFNRFLIALITVAFLSLSSCGVTYYNDTANAAKRTETSVTTKKGSKTTTVEDKKRQEIVAYAKKQLGANYRTGGKNPNGFDCSGFTSYVLKKFDVEIPSVSRSQATTGKKVNLKDAQPGDLVFFKRTAASKVFHVALVVNNGKDGMEVIHSTSSRGVVIDNITKSSYWKPKIASSRDVLSK